MVQTNKMKKLNFTSLAYNFEKIEQLYVALICQDL